MMGRGLSTVDIRLSALSNTVVRGDCLDVLADVPDESTDLAYLDPPFNTGKVQSAANGEYADVWPTMDGYMAFLEVRVRQVHRVLKDSGSILLHCDWRTCHLARLMLDNVFGAEQFVNHLIWRYGLGGSSPRRFARKHDDILFYGKSDAYYFQPPMVPATSARMKGMLKKATDVLDVPSINNMADERVGYPTQKPLALLELLVNACCPVDGFVLDPFSGSGTTLVAAQKTRRQYLGVDRNPSAVALARTRLAAESPATKLSPSAVSR